MNLPNSGFKDNIFIRKLHYILSLPYNSICNPKIQIYDKNVMTKEEKFLAKINPLEE